MDFGGNIYGNYPDTLSYGRYQSYRTYSYLVKCSMMDDFSVLVGILASSSIAINLYLIKSIANLCERLAKLEGFIHKHD